MKCRIEKNVFPFKKKFVLRQDNLDEKKILKFK